MDNGITFDGLGATVPTYLDGLQLAEITQRQLVDAARTIEWLKDPKTVDIWEALMVTIPYFSTPDQMKDLADYQADADWINIVANKAA